MSRQQWVRRLADRDVPYDRWLFDGEEGHTLRVCTKGALVHCLAVMQDGTVMRPDGTVMLASEEEAKEFAVTSMVSNDWSQWEKVSR